MAYEIMTDAERGVATWQATSGLKWKGAVLYQAWQCLDNGNIEWRPVPHDQPYAAGHESKE